MPSKTNGEGYLLIDNRASGGAVVERATITCSHCQRQMFRNPTRERERAYCRSCDHYICDECKAIEAVAGCRTFAKFINRLDSQTHRQRMI